MTDPNSPYEARPARRGLRILLLAIGGLVLLIGGGVAGFMLDIFVTEQSFRVSCPPVLQPEAGLTSSNYVGDGNTHPHVIDHPLRYPRAGQLANLQGTVDLQVYVEADGRVSAARLIRSSGFCPFDIAALEAVKDWRYQPALQGGKPVGTWWLTNVAFAIAADSGDAAQPTNVVPPGPPPA
jgi:TonB family protein